MNCTVCPGSSYPFYVVTYFIKWVTTSWTHSTLPKGFFSFHDKSKIKQEQSVDKQPNQNTEGDTKA